jgi:hypothetical protein
MNHRERLMACSCNKVELMICPNRTEALSAALEGLRTATKTPVKILVTFLMRVYNSVTFTNKKRAP